MIPLPELLRRRGARLALAGGMWLAAAAGLPAQENLTPVEAGGPDGAPAPDEPDTMRTWRARDGAAIEGALVSFDGEQVVLRRQDGRHFRLELSRLSPADAQWLQEQQQAAAARGQSLAEPFDLHFRVLRRLESPGRLVDTGEVTPMGARVQRREPPIHAVLLQGQSTGDVFAVPVSAALYEGWREGFNVPRRSLAAMLRTTEAELAGLYPYPNPDAVVVRALYGSNGGYRDVTFDVVAQIISGGQGGLNLASLAGEGAAAGSGPQELVLTILTPQGPTVRTVRDSTSLTQSLQ